MRRRDPELAAQEVDMERLETMVPVPGGALHVVADGDGPPILLLHAGIADLRAWDAMVPLLVEAGYRAVRFDLRGVGASQTEDVAFSRRADTLAVMDALGIGRAALVGNSIGGMVALEVAIETPDRVAALVMVASGIGGFDGGETPEEHAFEERMIAAEEAGDADLLATLDVELWVDGVGQPATRVDPAIRDLVWQMDRPSCEPGHVSGRPVPMDPPANERLGEVRTPTLAVDGELDASGTHAVARRIEEAIPGARRVVVPGVAHMIGMEVPETLAALVLEHVRPLGTWR
jgi:pimeloyl-ACP methyl ester carboxylesterase